MGEKLFIHTNTTTFLTGETLYCKLYSLSVDNTPSAVSKIAYIELLENTRKSIFRQKVFLENGIAQGDFFLPTTLKTGNYKLIGYTKWMLNNEPSTVFEMDVTVINPFQPLEPNNLKPGDTISKPTENEPAVQPGNGTIAIESDKKTYTHREKAVLKVKNTGGKLGKGHYSVSVRRIDELPFKKQITSKESIKNQTENQSAGSKIYLPELRGELISGSISSKKGLKDLRHKTVALSIVGKSFALKIAETDRLGKFTFILDKNPNLTNVVIQVLDESRNDYSIQLDDISGADIKSLRFLPEFQLNSNLKNTIEERSVANQVENAYYSKKKDSIAADLSSGSFFHPLEKVYVLDDYTRFPTMKETITEVILELYYKRTNGKYSIHLRNNLSNTEVYGQPLLMIDGLLIQDANELFDYNTENIEKISLINEPYIYGPKTFSGLVSITTKNQDYQTKASGDYIKNLDIARPLNQKKYYQPDYAGSQNARIPDYRHQLLWLPELTAGNAENMVSFYTSDVSGHYEIILEGFTESGVPVSLSNHFEVK
jgi:hypothetical protein